jgi:predicted XRE-type DNA-binding protein
MNSLMQVDQKLPQLSEVTQPVTPPEEPGSDVNQEPDREETVTRDEETPTMTEAGDVNQDVNTPLPDTPGEWIIVTDEIRDQMITRVKELQKAGMSYEKIGKLIGVSKGRITELYQGKMKKIHRPQYEALMSTQ